jgi:uncharacterized protein YndB with AHSA1/START domain
VTPVTQQNAISKSITVQAPQQRAFEVFTTMTGWWPVSTHHIGDADAAEVVIEPRAGGRWFERAADGTECEWGQVLSWDPYERVLLGWQLTEEWAYDPDFLTEVEVTFVPEGDRATRVTLEHRNLDRYGDRQAEMVETFDTGGWPTLLDLYAARATA